MTALLQQSTTDCININASINVPVLEYVAQPETCTPVGWGAFYELKQTNQTTPIILIYNK
jgi:hypothetical protein